MPIILINKHSGQQIMVKGESVAAFLEDQKGGRIPVEWPDGHVGDVMKDAIWATKVIPLAEHNKAVEEQKKAEAEKKAADEANAKALAYKQELDRLAARKPLNRIRKLFGRKAK